MRRALLALLTVGLIVSCQDGNLPTVSDRPDADAAISDGSGSFEGGNSHFFWLAPMVSQPDESLFGTFDPGMQPTVRIVCWEDSDPNATCDPGVPLAEFDVGSGVIVETDHYKVEFDTQAPDPALRTSSGDTDFTTYRIQALTPPLERFGGPFVFGFADFQLGENGKEARNLDGEETIGLVDGRTLPIRFRLDEGALEEELADHTAPTDDPTGAEAFCQINCSVTVIDQDEPTLASLADTATDDTLTAMLIPAGAVWTDTTTAVLVIDERVDDGDGEQGEECLPFSTLRTEACFRYELSPDNPNGDDFTQDVRFGICPEGQAVSAGAILPTWRLLKADLVGQEVVITRPDEVDVTDFLQCNVQTTAALWNGAGGRLAASALQWLVPPVDASDFWGGQLRDLSDLFWGEDVQMTTSTPGGTVASGSTQPVTVQLLATHPDPDEPAPSDTVVFSRQAGSGSLASSTGTLPLVGTPVDSVVDTNSDVVQLTMLTDANGEATVHYTVSQGSNLIEATSPAAEEGEPVTVSFTGGSTATLFQATFENEALATVPDSPEIGSWIGVNDANGEGTVLVLPSDSLGDITSQGVLFRRPDTANASVDLLGQVSGSSPTSGVVTAHWRSVVVTQQVGFADVSLRSSNNSVIASVAYEQTIGGANELTLNGSAVGSWTVGVSQVFELVVDLDNDSVDLFVDGQQVANDAPFAQTGSDVDQIFFNLGGGPDQGYGWDDVEIEGPGTVIP